MLTILWILLRNNNISNIDDKNKINLILGFICFDCKNLNDILYSFQKYVLKDFNHELSDEEMMYLTVHIKRIIKED